MMIRQADTSEHGCPKCLSLLMNGLWDPAMCRWYSPLNHLLSVVCRHVFCKACLQQVARAMKKCPTCRKAIRPNQIHRIYF